MLIDYFRCDRKLTQSINAPRLIVNFSKTKIAIIGFKNILIRRDNSQRHRLQNS